MRRGSMRLVCIQLMYRALGFAASLAFPDPLDFALGH